MYHAFTSKLLCSPVSLLRYTRDACCKQSKHEPLVYRTRNAVFRAPRHSRRLYRGDQKQSFLDDLNRSSVLNGPLTLNTKLEMFPT